MWLKNLVDHRSIELIKLNGPTKMLVDSGHGPPGIVEDSSSFDFFPMILLFWSWYGFNVNKSTENQQKIIRKSTENQQKINP